MGCSISYMIVHACGVFAVPPRSFAALCPPTFAGGMEELGQQLSAGPHAKT